MNHADITKVFTFTPLTDAQNEDLYELHAAAQELASVMYKVASPQAAQQFIGQLAGIVSQCRMSIELQPRQSERKMVIV